MTAATESSTIYDQPVNDLQAAYSKEREPLGHAPQGFRDDLGAPLKTSDKAVAAAGKLEGTLANITRKQQRGEVSSDQARRLMDTAIQEVRGTIDAQRKTGQAVADALPQRIVGRAWKEDVPDGADRDLVRDELEHLAESSPDGFYATLGDYVTEALAKGRTTDARLVMSRWGRAFARKHGVTDDQWKLIQADATRALAKVPDGTTSAANAKALELVDASQRASIVGYFLADSIVDRAMRHHQEAMQRLQG